MKLRTKIISTVIVLSTALNVALLTTFVLRDKQNSLDILKQKIQINSLLLNQVNAGSLYDMDISKLKTNLKSFFNDPEIVAIFLSEQNGNINIHFEESDFKNSEFIKKDTKIIYNEEQIGCITTYYTLSLIDKRLTALVLQMAISSLLVILITSITLYFLLKRITKPISDLTVLSAEIANGNLEKEIEVSTSDEIGVLSQSFMKMRDSIKNTIFSLKIENLERKAAEKELQKSQERLKIAQSIASVGDWELDLKENSFYLSDEASQIFNLDPNNSDHSYKEILSRIHQGDRERVDNAYQNSLKNKQFFNTSFRVPLEDDSVKYVEWISDSVCDESGTPVRSVGTIQDISKNKLAEIEKERLEEQLSHSRRMDAIGQLAGGVAHDFNNMLCGIRGAAQLLATPKMNLSEEGVEFVEIILQASSRAADLTTQLLAFGRKGAIASATVDIHRILDDTKALLNKTINKNINITMAHHAEVHTIIGDHTGLENIFINLCINSSHALPDGGDISIETKNVNLDQQYCDNSQFDIVPGEYIEISVVDTGSGIAPECLDQIFNPFFTTKEQGQGTGLGLAAVYGTVLNHNGAINVESELGIGTVFEIFFLCTTDRLKSQANASEIIKGTGRVLLVDDEDVIRNTCRRIIEHMGYEVILAENGMEALEIFERDHQNIDVVVMDMVMPKMNGREAFNKMREIDPNCKVVISSGYTRDEKIEDMQRMGLNGFIVKPFQNHELSKLLSGLIVKGKRI